MSKRREPFLARLLTFLALALGSAANANGSAFPYDAENHLTGMSVRGTTVSIVYDAFGNEVNHTGTTPNNYLYRKTALSETTARNRKHSLVTPPCLFAPILSVSVCLSSPQTIKTL